jgi:hypothetical protein
MEMSDIGNTNQQDATIGYLHIYFSQPSGDILYNGIMPSQVLNISHSISLRHWFFYWAVKAQQLSTSTAVSLLGNSLIHKAITRCAKADN